MSSLHAGPWRQEMGEVPSGLVESPSWISFENNCENQGWWRGRLIRAGRSLSRIRPEAVTFPYSNIGLVYIPTSLAWHGPHPDYTSPKEPCVFWGIVQPHLPFYKWATFGSRPLCAGGPWKGQKCRTIAWRQPTSVSCPGLYFTNWHRNMLQMYFFPPKPSAE